MGGGRTVAGSCPVRAISGLNQVVGLPYRHSTLHFTISLKWNFCDTFECHVKWVPCRHGLARLRLRMEVTASRCGE
jgi:hypothetical protein